MARLTLSFDNGPLIGATGRILDILAAWQVKTTFFLVGAQLENPAQRALAERAHAEGHWIGNHTMHHAGPLGLAEDPDRVPKEIDDANRMIGDLHHPDRFFRPQGRNGFGPHCLNRQGLDYCIGYGHTIVTTTNIPKDGEQPYAAWVDRVLAAVAVSDWTVTILHDKHLIFAMDNLAIFLDRATRTGVEIVQEFPETVLPMVRGEIRHPVESFVTL